MGFNATNAVVVGAATKVDHYDRVFDHGMSLRVLAAVYAGGRDTAKILDASFIAIPEAVIVPIDGDEVTGIEVHFTAKVDAGTGQVRLFNITTAAALGSAVNVTATTDTHGTITGLTPTSGANNYRVEGKKGTTWLKIWGARILLTQ